VLPFPVDTSRAQSVAPGVTHRFVYSSAGPWAIHVLDIALDRCYSAMAIKGAHGAIGREKVSTMLRELARTHRVIGGVNADFFLFAPPGVPSGAFVSQGRVVTGPSERPVLAISSGGTPAIMPLRVVGGVTVSTRRLPIAAWNRYAARGLALFDTSWSRMTDTATAVIEVVLAGSNPARVSRVDTLAAGVEIPARGAVIVAGRAAPDSLRDALLALRPGDTVRVDMLLAPRHVRDAVGGRPVLVRDSLVTADADTAGPTGKHPRTAVGIARGGRRLLLVVVDGRQPPYSMGMTLRELADLMLALGAHDALNLDGGGSTTMVYADPDSAGALRVANRPSDAQGERAVGNALAIVRGCPEQSSRALNRHPERSEGSAVFGAEVARGIPDGARDQDHRAAFKSQ
jgi:hypothetical protein